MAVEENQMTFTDESIEVAEVETTAVAKAGDGEVSSLIRLALERDVDVEVLERLVALQERVTERNARAAFFRDLADFQEAVPEIPKSKKASIDTRSGANFEYDFAPLDVIARTIRKPLREFGFSYSFDCEPMDGGLLNVVCVLRHIDGHEERAGFPVPTENKAAMSAAQKNGAALTYGRRQSLVAVLGLTTVDPDNDAGKDPALMEPITEKEAADIEALAAEVGADKDKFLAWLGVESIHEIRRKDHDRALRALMSKRSQA